MHLALGFIHEFGLDWSIHVKEDIIPVKIAEALGDAIIGSDCCGTTPDDGLWPSQILMLKNGPNGPEVFGKFTAGMHYPPSRQDDFVPWEEHHVTTKRLGTH